MIKAIETRYKGYHFRSRLEARWAVFFDALGIEWQYEPEGFELPSGKYLPDFFLPLRLGHWRYADHQAPGYWIEIKGERPTDLDRVLLEELAVHTGHNAQMLVGSVGDEEIISAPREGGFSELGIAGRFHWLAAWTDCRPMSADLSAAEYRRCVAAARSARFEHGQSGAL